MYYITSRAKWWTQYQRPLIRERQQLGQRTLNWQRDISGLAGLNVNLKMRFIVMNSYSLTEIHSQLLISRPIRRNKSSCIILDIVRPQNRDTKSELGLLRIWLTMNSAEIRRAHRHARTAAGRAWWYDYKSTMVFPWDLAPSILYTRTEMDSSCQTKAPSSDQRHSFQKIYISLWLWQSLNKVSTVESPPSDDGLFLSASSFDPSLKAATDQSDLAIFMFLVDWVNKWMSCLKEHMSP